MGEFPYAGLTNGETSEKVIGGYRLPQPTKCPIEIYSLMLQCWEENAKLRPSIRSAFEKLNEYASKYETKTETNNRIRETSYSEYQYTVNKPTGESLVLSSSLFPSSSSYRNNVSNVDPNYMSKEVLYQ